MTATRPAPLAKVELPTAQIARAALRRLAIERIEPTPEHYERAYRQESGEPPPETTEALATLIERIVRGVERSGHNWTPARRKEGIQRVLASGRGVRRSCSSGSRSSSTAGKAIRRQRRSRRAMPLPRRPGRRRSMPRQVPRTLRPSRRPRPTCAAKTTRPARPGNASPSRSARR